MRGDRRLDDNPDQLPIIIDGAWAIPHCGRASTDIPVSRAPLVVI
jgi:hypothetical protein